ncbi:hypothetical protein FSST1_003782 [Fusarium sambucinum]
MNGSVYGLFPSEEEMEFYYPGLPSRPALIACMLGCMNCPVWRPLISPSIFHATHLFYVQTKNSTSSNSSFLSIIWPKMDEFATNLRQPVRHACGRRTEVSETLKIEPNITDGPSRASRTPGLRDSREIIDLTDDRSRSPQGRCQILTRAIISSFTDVARGREPGIPIKAHCKLVTEEKQKLGEWLRRSSRATGHNLRVTIRDFHCYLDAILKYWSSESSVPGEPSLRNRSSFETSIEVGAFKVNAPLRSISPRKTVTVLESDDIISFTPGLEQEEIHDRAIANYDHYKLERVRSHNSAIIVDCARRAIKVWTQCGTEDDPDIDVQEPQGLQTCSFARDRVEPAKK